MPQQQKMFYRQQSYEQNRTNRSGAESKQHPKKKHQKITENAYTFVYLYGNMMS